MIKYLLASLVLFSSAVFGQTVINYPDGSTYTLEDGQQIYISTSNSALFKRQLMKNKDTFFRVQKPWEKRDHVPEETDGMEPGSDEWCEVYVPFQNGYTFDDQMWQRACQG
jgi:hypothetical protein